MCGVVFYFLLIFHVSCHLCCLCAFSALMLWMGVRKNIRPVKTSSNPLGMVVNVSWWSIAQRALWCLLQKRRVCRVFGLSDTWDKNDWRLGIRWPVINWKMASKVVYRVCIIISFTLFLSYGISHYGRHIGAQDDSFHNLAILATVHFSVITWDVFCWKSASPWSVNVVLGLQ